MKKFTQIIFVSLTFLLFACNTAGSDDPKKKHAELQKLEIDIVKKIKEGDENAALDLLKDFIHPSHSSYECTENIRGNWGCYTYEEWWTERREYFQEQLTGVGAAYMENSSEQNLSGADTNYQDSTESDSTRNSQLVLNGQSLAMPDNYLGLYVFQFSNGNTKFFKFFKDSQGESGVVYQDNVSGNVRVENYVIRSFNESTKEIALESKKSPGTIVGLRFAADPDSDNGLKLIDVEGTTFSLVGK